MRSCYGAIMSDAKLLNLTLIISISAILIALILAIFLIIALVNMRKMNQKYAIFMKGADGKELETAILSRVKDIDKMKADIDFIFGKLSITCDTLLTAFQKSSIVKYDAFKEMGGKLSYSLAILDDKNNGYILTSMHTREGCYTYAKEIIKGESFVILSDEERQALEEAKNKTNYMVAR